MPRRLPRYLFSPLIEDWRNLQFIYEIDRDLFQDINKAVVSEKAGVRMDRSKLPHHWGTVDILPQEE
jgi:hypothetical protein